MQQNMGGVAIPDRFKGKQRQTFFQTVDVQLGAAGSATGTTAGSIEADAEAELCLLGAAVVVTDAADTNRVAFGNVLVELTNATTSRGAQNKPVHLHNLAGTAENPAVFPAPVFVPANSKLRTTFTNKAAAGLNVRLVFYGYRVTGA